MRCVMITGASGGLGLPTTLHLLKRGFEVVATARTEEGENAIKSAAKDVSEKLTVLRLDLAEKSLSCEIIAALHNIDGLINNAGDEADLPRTRSGGDGSVLAMDWEEFQHALWINANGARRLMQECIPLMTQKNFGRIVNVSSARASLGEVIGEVGAPCYDISKTVLNAFTAHLGHELRHTNVLVNALCPGWCATPMGGPNAPDTPEQGAARIIRLLDLPKNGPNGKFFMNDHIVNF